ncbi:MAG: HAMP domain-containing histidine kinase [Oligoflexia bacterium]|nr:HAMP domain-containing histidine kinase [Oligoflexia bacterium]MBF0365300.1 HAMP domain-containing histidine kinase [Oligoflexia bacterium]
MLRPLRLLKENILLEIGPTKVALILLLTTLLHHVCFYFISSHASNKTVLGVTGLLRQQFVDYDPYKISETLHDLESLNLIKCSQFTNLENNLAYLDMRYKSGASGGCEESFFLLNGIKKDVTIIGANNIRWDVQFLSINDGSFLLARLFTLILLLVFILSYLFSRGLKLKNEKQVSALKDQSAEQIMTLASQVSHDIRSPLTALASSARSWIHLLPEDDRVIVRSQIQRIQDIANDLLRKRKEIKSGKSGVESTSKLEPQLLSSCIEEIVTEKRMTFRQHIGLHIEANVEQTYGVFAIINLVEFKRLISNLINNATEAYDDKKGEIKVQLVEDELNAILSVEDNGKGIPPEVLAKLGSVGVTYGKGDNSASGNGLGVAHAKKSIEDWGGRFKIESEVGKGTKIILAIPKTTAPHWFVSKISLESNMAIVILDDDAGIHQTWDKRLEGVLACSDSQVEVVHLSTPDDFSSWVQNHSAHYNKVLYLCDYELLGHKVSGLDLIEKHSLNGLTYLVTSHYEEEKIRTRCKELGVKLIPKMLAGLVPIEVKKDKPAQSEATLTTDLQDVQAVLVDDDEYIRIDWSKYAKKAGIKFLAVESSAQLMNMTPKLSKELCEVFIDRELGEGLPKGEDVAITLYEQGFKKLSLATGHPADMFAHLPWLKCQGKVCPWSDEDDDW